jgi:hypothetical protein
VAEAVECRGRQNENTQNVIGLYLDMPDPVRLAKAFHFCRTDPRHTAGLVQYPNQVYAITTACVSMAFNPAYNVAEMRTSTVANPVENRLGEHLLAAMRYCG